MHATMITQTTQRFVGANKVFPSDLVTFLRILAETPLMHAYVKHFVLKLPVLLDICVH